jgi:hypothetical protein
LATPSRSAFWARPTCSFAASNPRSNEPVSHSISRERGHEAYAIELLGEIASYPESPNEKVAQSYYCQAISLAKELGMRPLVAHCHLGLGKLYRRTGKGEQAQEHLTTATTMYREMGMTYWLEQAEAEATGLA